MKQVVLFSVNINSLKVLGPNCSVFAIRGCGLVSFDGVLQADSQDLYAEIHI
jgi:hypothetical protein